MSKLFKEQLASIIDETMVEAPTATEQKKLIYASYGHTNEANWIEKLGFKLTGNIEDADVVVFGGGKDIDPGWYNEKKGSRTDTPNIRDRAEKKDFDTVQNLRKQGRKILSVGVCRGAQLACALSGGKLIQDVGNHVGTHSIATFDRKEFDVNSIHHQMLFPYNMDRRDYKILAWSKKNISSRYLNGWDKDVWKPDGFKEIEVAFFVNTNFLAIQSHPEMMIHSNHYMETVHWMQELFIKHYNETYNG